MKNMNRYLAVLSTSTYLKFNPAEEFEFKINDIRILLRKIRNSKDELITGLKNGWLIEIELNAENIDKAITSAMDYSEFILSMCCLSTGHPTTKSNIVLTYEITDNIEERPFKQYFQKVPLDINGAAVEFYSLEENIKKFFNYSGKYIDRIGRAIKWFRKGIISDYSLDQFLFFWHGLETLNSPLAEYYGKGKSLEKEIGRKCSHCGKGCTVIVPGGIEALYEDIGLEDSTRKKIKDVRNGISHGYMNIDQLSNLSMELLPEMAKILHYAISTLIDIDYNSVHKNLNNLAPIKIGDLFFYQGFLIQKDISKLGQDDYYPYFELKIENGIDCELKPFIHDKCHYKGDKIAISGNLTAKIEIRD
jgi:hypothetical protein